MGFVKDHLKSSGQIHYQAGFSFVDYRSFDTAVGVCTQNKSFILGLG